MRNTSRPDITKRTFPEPKNFFAARHLASFPAFRGERFLGLTVISRASRHHRQIRARGMGDGEESCAVCSRSIGGPKAETLTAECCRRRFHDLCIARHCATRRDEVPSPRTRRVFGGVVVHAPKRATIDRPDHQRLDGPFTFPSPPPPRHTAGPLPRVRRPFAEARGGRRGRRRIKRPSKARQTRKTRMGNLRAEIAKSRRYGEGVRASLRRSPRAPATDRGRESAHDGGGGCAHRRGGRDRPGRGLEAGGYRGHRVAARPRARGGASSRETNPRLSFISFRGLSRASRAPSRARRGAPVVVRERVPRVHAPGLAKPVPGGVRRAPARGGRRARRPEPTAAAAAAAAASARRRPAAPARVT